MLAQHITETIRINNIYREVITYCLEQPLHTHTVCYALKILIGICIINCKLCLHVHWIPAVFTENKVTPHALV